MDEVSYCTTVRTCIVSVPLYAFVIEIEADGGDAGSCALWMLK